MGGDAIACVLQRGLEDNAILHICCTVAEAQTHSDRQKRDTSAALPTHTAVEFEGSFGVNIHVDISLPT